MLGIVALFVVWLGVIPTANYVITRYIDVKPLGGKLDFIGKSDNGCPMYLWPCMVGPPHYELYYATDMKPWELAGYFKGAEVTDKKYASEDWYANEYGNNWNDVSFMDDTYCDDIPFANRSTKVSFTLHICKDSQTAVNAFNLLSTSKPFTLSMDPSQYAAAKSSL
jgi:hypothetical protein